MAPDAPSMCVRIDDSVPVIVVPPELTYEQLREWVAASLPEHLPTINGRTSRLDFGERQIQLLDLRRLLHLLRDTYGVDITGLYLKPEAIHRFAERELKLKLFPLDVSELPTEEIAPDGFDDPVEYTEDADDDEPEVEEEEPPAEARPALATEMQAREEPGRRTLSLHRTLRSGASVRFDGDVVLYGDVNPGAQIVAAGNIVVLGALKGMAHAGATGDEDSFIMSFDLRPTQLRVGRKIAIPPERGPGHSFEPHVAHVTGEQIVIEPYRTSLSLLSLPASKE